MLGFEQPSRGEVLRLDGQEWRPVVVAEDRDGFVVRDRRRIPLHQAGGIEPPCAGMGADLSSLPE